jgi:hypothetical protein
MRTSTIFHHCPPLFTTHSDEGFTVDRRSSRRKSTQDTTEDTQHARARDDNARQRAQTALDMRSQGHNFDAIAAKCGYTHRSAARKAWQRAIADLAEDTAEESRLLFKASYGPVRACHVGPPGPMRSTEDHQATRGIRHADIRRGIQPAYPVHQAHRARRGGRARTCAHSA